MTDIFETATNAQSGLTFTVADGARNKTDLNNMDLASGIVTVTGMTSEPFTVEFWRARGLTPVGQLVGSNKNVNLDTVNRAFLNASVTLEGDYDLPILDRLHGTEQIDETSPPAFIIEIIGEDVSLYLADGSELTQEHDNAEDWNSCAASGDVQEACEYVRDNLAIDWRIVKRNPATGEIENMEASDDDLQAVAEGMRANTITRWEADFSDPDTAKTYLVWQVASEFKESA